MSIIGVAADDLTGSTTTGELLARMRIKTTVYMEPEVLASRGDNGSIATIVNCSSRALLKEEAYAVVKGATKTLKEAGAKYFSKRIDTTMRGGLGVEIDAMLDELGDSFVAVMVPSMPQSRRILVGGFSIIDNIPLIETPVAQDVRTPVTENYIPALVGGQSKRKVSLIDLNKVLAGSDAVKEAMKAEREAGARILIVDAVTLVHVDVIAKAVVELGWDVVAVDPGPLTSRLALARGIGEEEKPDIPENPADCSNKTVLVVAGSASPVTRKQMNVLWGEPGTVRVHADAQSFIKNEESRAQEVREKIEEITELIKGETHTRVILIETAMDGALINLQETDRTMGKKQGWSAETINHSLGEIAAGVIANAGRSQIAGMYMTGGDTMVDICRALSSDALEMVDYVIPQADISRMTGPLAGMPVVGKGGLTGNDRTACDIVDRLFMEASR